MGKTPVPFGPKPAGCSAFEIWVARGTSEPGPFGVIVGDNLVAGVAKLVADSRGYAVQYPADASGTSVSSGVADVVKRLTDQDKACPSQKFALVGYSQGAGVMRAAAPKIPSSLYPKILALVMFGDPALKRGGRLPEPLQSRLFENCAAGDPVCSPGNDFGPHMTYSRRGTDFQADSAKFIAAAFKGTPLPAKTSVPEASGGASPKGKGAGSPQPQAPKSGN